MDRFGDIQEVLADVTKFRQALEARYEEAKGDASIKQVLRPTVKSALEHLRSALEFCAQDIHAKFYPSRDASRLYFPFGAKQENFERSISKNFPKLKQIAPNVFNEIEALQPFKSGDAWLVGLCTQTNFNKHNRLSPQERVESPGSVYEIPGLVRWNEGSNIAFSNCSFNGVPIGTARPMVLDGSKPFHEVRAAIPSQLGLTQQFDWVQFNFAGTAEDTLSLIARAHDQITKFSAKIHILVA